MSQFSDKSDISTFTIYHWVCNKINTTSTNYGAGTEYPSGTPEFTFTYSGVCVAQSLCCVLYIIVCPFVVYLLAIVFSVRFLFTASDYPFLIFTFFIHMIHHFQQYFSYIIKVRYISGGNQYLEKTKDLPQFADISKCDSLILLKW
jgi:hypothetical protein